ncbi:MAG: phage tail protein [Roseitalea sp.]|nr:phage tail protein [Roseitalea sp.]MBO6950972.1 phage tail protein [Rhizobiaceae bacterium]MBO6591041.1 phage tail protein [Roseitalea sp.]MBO6599701.1 phage tail protein [Roseitalea sp.]MBO6611457.1 phage tail protein [Roseitalea sp.]
MFKMALGPFRFSVRFLPVVEQRRITSARFAKHAVGKRVPVKQFLGPNDDAVTIAATIYPEVISPSGPTTLAGLRIAARLGRVMAFIADGGPYFGMYVIDEVGEGNTHFLPDGRPQKITVEIKISERGR